MDEAGDDSTRSVTPIDNKGGSEWFILAGILVRKCNEHLVDEWITNIRLQVGQVQGDGLHYRKMSSHYRAKCCNLISELPIKCFTVASNKKNMRGYDNPRASTQNNPNWFYNFCLRILLERATELCAYDASMYYKSPKKLKIIFSQRDNHSYCQTSAYIDKLINQARSGRTYLKTREIQSDILDRRLIESAPHSCNGGLQLADIAASAFYQAVETSNYKFWTATNAMTLMPIMARRKDRVAHQGLVLLPSNHWEANLNSKQKQIFTHYGYDI